MGLLESGHFRTARPKLAFLTGPRGSGKTTLAKELQTRRGSQGVYGDWGDFEFRRQAAVTPYAFLDSYQPLLFKKVLAVIDEINHFPQWKQYMHNLWRTRSSKIDFIVISSGICNLSDQLKHKEILNCKQYHMHPFSLSEVLQTVFSPDKDTPVKVLDSLLKAPPIPGRRSREAFEALLRFGGFPESFVAQNQKRHVILLRERHERLIKEDLRDLSRIQMLSSVEHLVALILAQTGTILSFNKLRKDLGVNIVSARLWAARLEHLHFCFRVAPFAGRLERCLRLAPKFYLYDWSEVDDAERRFENMTACALLRWCHFCGDWGQGKLELHHVRDKEKRSVPFLLTLNRKPFLLVGTTAGEVGATRNLKYFAARMGKVPAMLVTAGRKQLGDCDGVSAVPGAAFFAVIP